MVRTIGTLKFGQRTKDGYFDANSLLTEWNSKKTNPKRQMLEFLESKKTLEFVEVLNDELAQSDKSDMAFVSKKGVNTAKGRTKDEVWMHPYLFIDFAMWISPKFKLEVIKFVYDELIKQRNDAGDNYKALTAVGVKLQGYDFKKVAEAIQYIVFNRTQKNIRQFASESELKEMNEVQTTLAWAIERGYIDTYPKLIQELSTMWKKKHRKTPF